MGLCSSAEQISAALEPGPTRGADSKPVGEEDVTTDEVVRLLPSFEDGGWADPRGWELEHVHALTEAWKDAMGSKFTLSRDELGEWLAAVPQLQGRDTGEFADRIFAAFDRDSDTVDALAVISAFSILCRGDANSKLTQLFNLFDFEGAGVISEDDMTVMALAAVHGVVSYLEEGALPEEGFEDACESFARRAFEEARDAGEGEEGIGLERFKAFVLSRFDPDAEGGAVRDDLAQFWDLDAEQDDADFAADEDELPRTEEDALFEEHTGDQFMAVKPWIGAIREPSSPPPIVNAAPVEELVLEHVYGYRGFDARNNAVWTPNGHVAYHTAALGVVLNPSTNQQRFYYGHTEDVVALAQHPDGSLIATGEMGRYPTVRVWDATSVRWDDDAQPASAREVACIRVKSLRRAATALAWSPSGNRLAVVGQDDEHTLHVFDLTTTLEAYQETRSSSSSGGVSARPQPPRLLGSSNTHGNKVLDCAWRDEDTVGVVGVKFACFATVHSDGGGVSTERGLFGRKGKIEAIISAVALPNGTLLTGSASGRLYAWSGRQVSRAVRAHRGAVYALSYDVDSDTVYTGGRDGFVRAWSASLDPKGGLSLKGHATAPTRVRAVQRSPSRGEIVIGTLGGQLLTAPDSLDAGADVLLSSHYYGELWAVDVHPSEPLAVTAGDDSVVRVWDLHSRTCVRSADVGTWVRTVSWSPDGAHIACGTGGRLGGKIPKVNGDVLLLDAASLEVTARAAPSKRAISVVKFSPDGACLAVGGHDAKIYLFDVDGGSLSPRAKCSGHSAYITHIDWSEDSQYLQSNCGAYELLFWDANTGQQQTSGATQLRDEQWATWTCTLGWPVQGIWPPYSDGTDINAVARSASKRCVATSDDFGKVKLFRWPIPDKGFAYTEYRGHSSHVTNVCFTAGDSHLISTGGNDKSVFQWRMIADEAAVAEEEEVEVLEEDDEVNLDEMGLLQAAKEAPDRGEANDFAQLLEGGGYTGVGGGEDQLVTMEATNIDDAIGAGEQFMAVKPWVGAMVAPSDEPEADTSAPAVDLSLEWVHGYQAQTLRNSLRYTKAGEIVYSSAALALVYSEADHAQRLFAGHHRDDIISLAVSPCGRYVATGERGRRPAVFVWDASTQEVLATLEGHHFRGVVQLAFDPTGRTLATVGLDDNHTLIVYDWRAGTRLVQQKVDTRTILGLAWSPTGDALCTVGSRHICFWELNGSGMRRRRGLLGSRGKQQTLRCVTMRPSDGAALVGTTDGAVYVFKGRTLQDVVPAHDGPVDSMYVDADSDTLFTGSKNGSVKEWDVNAMEVKHEVTVASSSSVRSVCCAKGDPGKLLVGTARSEVYQRGAAGDDLMLMLEAHFYGETWGLAAHPVNSTFATAGDDGTVRVWDADTMMVMRSGQVDTLARALAFNADGSRLAVALGGRLGGKERGPEGKVVILDGETLDEVASVHDAAQWCEDIRFSPDGACLAVGGHDCKIYLYDFVDDALSLRAKCSGHSSYITHIDWSEDSQYLQSNCGAYELLFWDANTGQQQTSASALRDVQWATWTCTLGWPVQGIWPAAADGTDVNAVDRSHSGDLLATADDFGRVKLFRCPCTSTSAAFLYGLGHSSHVTNIRWLVGDRYVVSTGGNDRAVFLWRVKH